MKISAHSFIFLVIFQFIVSDRCFPFTALCSVGYGNCSGKAANTYIIWLFKRCSWTRPEHRSNQALLHRPQITATHQPLAVWTPCQGAITTNPHRRGPDGQVYCFWFPSLLLPLSSPLSVLHALCFVKWSAMINCAENFAEGLKWSSVASVCLLNFLTFLCAERKMAALYGTASSSLIVNTVGV